MKSSSLESPSKMVKDKFFLVYYFFFLLGLVHVVPLSFFVTAHSYWMYKFRNVSSTVDYDPHEKTYLQVQFSPAVTVSLHFSGIFFYFLGLFLGHKFTLNFKLFSTLSIILGGFVLGAIFIFVDTDDWQMGFFVLSMLTIGIINAMNAVFGLGNMEMTAYFPNKYLGAYLTGQGLATIFNSLLNIIAISIGVSTTAGALIYFWIAIGVLTITLGLLFLIVYQNAFYKHYTTSMEKAKKKEMLSLSRCVYLFKKVWPGTGIMFFFTLTINTLYPAITTLVVPENSGNSVWADKYFQPVITFLMFAIMDYFGRFLAFKIKILHQLRAPYVVVFAAIRAVVFIPLVMLCNAQPRSHLSVIFDKDYQYIIIMIFFALTNGFCSYMTHFVVPQLVTSEEKEEALQLNMVITSTCMGVFAFISFLSVNVL